MSVTVQTRYAASGHFSKEELTRNKDKSRRLRVGNQ